MGGSRFTAVVLSSLTLALGLIVGTLPAAAVTPFFHAAFFAQSAYPTIAPGQATQLSAVYQNTGDKTWEKGVVGAEARMATDAPNDNTTYFDRGWAVNWLARDRFAAQNEATVAPDEFGSWTWTIRPPADENNQTHRLYGHEIIDNLAPGPFNASRSATYYEMEDFGFFLDVTIRACQPPETSQPCVSATSAGL